MSPTERYDRDPVFRVLVDSLAHQLEMANYTPTELREAVILAAIIHHDRRPRIVGMDAYDGIEPPP